MPDEKPTEKSPIEFPPDADVAWRDTTKRQRSCVDLKVPDSGLEWLDALIMASRELDIEQHIEQFRRIVPVQMEMGAQIQQQAQAHKGRILKVQPVAIRPGRQPQGKA